MSNFIELNRYDGTDYVPVDIQIIHIVYFHKNSLGNAEKAQTILDVVNGSSLYVKESHETIKQLILEASK